VSDHKYTCIQCQSHCNKQQYRKYRPA